MTNKPQLLQMVVCALIVCAPLARSQETRIDVLSAKRDETRFGPGMLCEDITKPAISPARSLALSLVLPEKQTYKVGEEAAFELTIRNSGTETVVVPSEACSEKSALANRPGVLETCINLNYTTSAGDGDWFTGPCLCGREDSKNLKELKTGESMVVRGNAEVLLGAELFGATYNGEKPSLILTPDMSFFREHFPAQEGSKAIDGCVEELHTRIEAENNASVQIAAAPRNKKNQPQVLSDLRKYP
jgi:hypothetical protein